MNPQLLTADERAILLRLARQSIERAAAGHGLPEIDVKAYSPALQADGAAFVTLTADGNLRGCIGTLQAYQPLVQDVCEHAAAAAVEDYRFSPVTPPEVARLHIEISRLTIPTPLDYQNPAELLAKLRPGVDGVILYDGGRRATFLPQVWEKLPDAAEFLDNLCYKMGAAPNLWRRKLLKVEVYQVEEFEE